MVMFFLPVFAVLRIFVLNFIEATPFMMVDVPMFLPFSINVTVSLSFTFMKFTVYVSP